MRSSLYAALPMETPIADLDVSISEVAGEMDRGGLVCLDGVLSREWLEAARDSVKSHLATHGDSRLFHHPPL